MIKPSTFGPIVLKTVSSLILLTGLPGCSLVPQDGPSAKTIMNPSFDAKNKSRYIVVDLTNEVATRVKDYQDKAPVLTFSDLPTRRSVGIMGPGDVLHITIWEATAAQEGVFTQKQGSEVTAVVDERGKISVPYAGRFSIAGMSLSQIETQIVKKLEGKVYSPQVSVQLNENVFNTVFLQGEIGHPGRFPLTPGGDTLLDLIALAGGPRLQPHETLVQVVRDGRSVTTDLYRVMNDPTLNVELSPGDSVVLTRRLDMFYAFGAVNNAGQQPFNEHTTTLLQALGAIAGLKDERADPKGVFIFRREPVNLARTLTQAKIEDKPENFVQVVYRLDMADPNSFFILHAFPVQPSDIIYVSNAPLREYQKVIDSVIGTTGNLVNTGVAAAALSKD